MWKTKLRNGERGAVAVVVAVCIVLLITIAAVAIDVGRMLYVRNNLQIALDGAMKAAGAAAVSLPADMTPQQVQAESLRVARRYLATNFKLSSGLVDFNASNGGNFSVVYIPPDTLHPNTNNEDSVVGTVRARVPLSFARILNIDSVPITLTARVKRPRPAPVELAIVADVTESMNDPFGSSTKIAALKSSASSLVTTLMKGDNVRVGLLPIAGLVRLDTANNYHNPGTMIPSVPWLRMTPDPNIEDCLLRSTTDCKTVNYTCYRDGLPYTCPIKTCTCLKSQKRAYYWDGCVFLRPGPARTTISNPTVTPYYALTSSGACAAGAQIITDLLTKGRNYVSGGKTYTAEQLLQARITAMKVIVGSWGTYIPAGLIWAWNMLTTETTQAGAIDNSFPLNAGFTDQETRALGVRKALVLITDGSNTMFANPVFTNKVNTYDSIANIANPGYTAAQKQTLQTQVSNDMATICQNIRAAGINIYVIGLQVSTDLAYTALLRDRCAGPSVTNTNPDPNYFFDVADPGQLRDAFARIGAAYSNNTLTK